MLTFNLKKQWFDKIKSGEKTHENRLTTDYWKKRISKQSQWNELRQKGSNKKIPLFDITFCCGYPKKGDKERRLSAVCLSWHIINGKNTDLAIDKDVYDIEFELIGDKENVCKD